MQFRPRRDAAQAVSDSAVALTFGNAGGIRRVPGDGVVKMGFIGRRFVVVALAALTASSMVAASEPEFFDSVFVQTWQFHDRAEGPSSCSVTLLMDGGAMASEDCAGSYPVLSDLSAWRPLSTSALELRNDGGAFLRFSSVSPDELEAKDGARTYVLGVEVVSDEQYTDEGAAYPSDSPHPPTSLISS
jgi:hypothetical protein